MLGPDYGGYVWSTEKAQPPNPVLGQALPLGIAAVVGGAAAWHLTKTHSKNHSRPIDWVIEAATYAANRTPFQVGNTLRVPEWLSPFASRRQQGLKSGLAGMQKGMYGFGWSKGYLRSNSSYNYLNTLVGDSNLLNQAGIAPGTFDDEFEGLFFERTAQSSRGNLYAMRAGKRIDLKTGVMLFHATTHREPFTGHEGLNKAAQGVMQAMGLYDNPAFEPREVFTRPGKVGRGRNISKFLPISGSVLPSAYLAFEGERFNQVISNLFEQVAGADAKDGFIKVFGFSPNVRPGTAGQQFIRTGAKFGALAGLALGVQQTDWIRRQGGFLGNQVVSAGVSGLVAMGANRYGFRKETSLAIGLGAHLVQTLFPGFDQGVVSGATETYARLSELRAGSLNPAGYIRRTWEGLLPGSTGFESGVLFGLVGVAALNAHWGSGKTLPQYLYSHKSIGPQRIFGEADDVLIPKTLRQHYATVKEKSRFNKPFTDAASWGRPNLLRLNNFWEQAEHNFRTAEDANPINLKLEKRLQEIADKADPSFMGQVAKNIRGFASQVYYSFFGANSTKITSKIRDMGYARPVGSLGRSASVFAGLFGLHQIVTGSAFGSLESAETLRKQYSGQELVPVKKSRFWESGGTPFSGGNIDYYRPSAVHLILNRVREKGIWGSEEDRISPIGKFLRKNFTYSLERQNYYDRPYPITNSAFADVPIIGGLLSSTIGRLIKPPKLMHLNEWQAMDANGNIAYAHVYEGNWSEPAWGMMPQSGPGIPLSPYSPGYVAGTTAAHFREMAGLPGWFESAAQKFLTGSEDFIPNQPVLADSGMMTSFKRRFWESEIGGGLFTSELARRIFAKNRYDYDRENPILNTMPSWLPEKFHYGDPYTRIPWGEARLPGAGYAALHPELTGMDPEDYPLVHQYNILANVAPQSYEFRKVQTKVYTSRAKGLTTEAQNNFIDQVDNYVRSQMNIKEFDYVHDRAIEIPFVSKLTQGIWGRGKQAIRDVAAPIEYLIPFGFRPTQKLMGDDRDMISQYEYERMYGTQLAFWDRPWRDWFRPSLNSAAHMLGFDGKPQWRRDADATNEYFDKLEFIKWMNLAQNAEGRERQAYLAKASRTRAGVNPQGSPMGIYWSLPESEKAFFNAFAYATGSDRERILQMIPQDQVALYKSVWNRMDSGDSGLWAGSRTQVDDTYLSQQMSRAQSYVAGRGLPSTDWIGWHQDVDVSDIKALYIDHIGRDLKDYDLWEKQLVQAEAQPYLEGSVNELPRSGYVARSFIANDLYAATNVPYNHPSITVHGGQWSASNAKFVYQDDRREEITDTIRKVLVGY